MQRYFAKQINNKIVFDDGDVHHLLHVMRNKKGDEIEAVADNKLYACLIKSINPLDIEINYEIPVDSELPTEVTLFFALSKGDKIGFVIQKATELGVHKIVLIKTERCVVKLSQDDFLRKLDRYQKIAKEASEQSHRLIVPEIVGVIDIKNIPQELLCDTNLLAYEKEAGKTDTFLDRVTGKGTYSIMIGPEGGFSLGEVELLVNKYGFSESSAKKIMKSKKLKRKIKKFLKENNQYVEYVD